MVRTRKSARGRPVNPCIQFTIALKGIVFKFLRQLRSRILAFDYAWDIVFNTPQALAEEEQIVVRNVKKLSAEDIEFIRKQIKEVEQKTTKSKILREQLAVLRREIMTEAENFKIKQVFLSFPDDLRPKMQTLVKSETLEDWALATSYFVGRFKFAVLRYAALFRYDDLGEKDWYSLFSAIIDQRNKVYSRVGEYFLKHGHPSAEAMIVQKWDEYVIPQLKDELAYWPPKMKVPEGRMPKIEPITTESGE